MLATMMLTADELKDWTGYKMAALQIAWLKANGHPHTVNALGRPIVSRAYWEKLHGGDVQTARRGPNWAALPDRA